MAFSEQAKQIRSNWDLLKEIYRYGGLSATVLRISKKLVKPVIRIDRYIFHQRDLSVVNSEYLAKVPLVVRQLTMQEAEVFGETFKQSAERVRERLSSGDQCFIGIAGKQIVHHQWFVISSTHRHLPVANTGFALVIRPGDAYAYSGYTLPAWRGKGIAPCVSSVKHQYLKSLGCTRKLSYKRGDNIWSARWTGKFGNWRAERSVYTVRLFRSSRPWIFGARSDEAFSFVRMRSAEHRPLANRTFLNAIKRTVLPYRRQ